VEGEETGCSVNGRKRAGGASGGTADFIEPKESSEACGCESPKQPHGTIDDGNLGLMVETPKVNPQGVLESRGR
jgi:hypothetical protein